MANDDNDEQPPTGHFMFGGAMTPEQVAAYKEAMAQQEMYRTDGSHEMIRFFTDLSKDQMLTAKKLMSVIAGSDEPNMMATFYSGMLGGLLQTLHGICLYCLVSHEDELKKIMEPPAGEA